MKDSHDDAVARALGVLVGRPDANDTLLKKFLEGAAREDACLARARKRLGVGDAHWFRCSGEACRDIPGPPGLGAGSPCAQTDTGCQGLCEHAPVGVARVGTRFETFAGFDGAQPQLGAFLRRAANTRHFWVDDDGALDFRFDPVHDVSEENTNPLGALAFLVGHFRGEGRYVASESRFYKELHGAWAAGRRALTLRMSVGFPLRDGRRDQHEALVVIRRVDGEWVGDAIEDGGGERRYSYSVREDASLCFADRAPGHGDSATGAQKCLVPTETGYLERLEVERDGSFELYSEIEMIRVGG